MKTTWNNANQRNSRPPGRGYSPRSGVKTARQLLYWLAIAVAVVIAFWNMMPYTRASFYALVEVFGLTADASNIFANRALGMISLVMGAIIWALIQTAEVYPVLLRHDRKLMRLMALEAESAEQLEVRDTDDPALARLKDWYNQFPLLSLRSANRASLFAYLVDLAICLSVYPPVDGGFGKLLFILFTGQWGLISWANVALIIVMLFCFETMVRAVLFLGIQYYWIRRAHSN